MSGVIRLNAGHDRNGNPRRLYVVIDGTTITDVIDEGYEGTGALRGRLPRLRGSPPDFRISASEYNELKRRAEGTAALRGRKHR
jgi:hypothetical protein